MLSRSRGLSTSASKDWIISFPSSAHVFSSSFFIFLKARLIADTAGLTRGLTRGLTDSERQRQHVEVISAFSPEACSVAALWWSSSCEWEDVFLPVPSITTMPDVEVKPVSHSVNFLLVYRFWNCRSRRPSRKVYRNEESSLSKK